MKKKNSTKKLYILVILIFLISILGLYLYSNNNYKSLDAFTPRTINKNYPTIEEVCKEESGRRIDFCEILESNQKVVYKKSGLEANSAVNKYQIIEVWKPISEIEWKLIEVKYHHKCSKGITSLFWNTSECN